MDDTLFDFIDSILFSKKKLENINEGETEFNPYMIGRWISMISPEMTVYTNETLNRFKGIFNTKQEVYEYCLNIYPRCRKVKINYLKKNNKKEKPLDDEKLNLMAKCLEKSKRELSEDLKFLEELKCQKV